MWNLSESAIAEGNYESAEKYLNATLELGRLINRDPELAYNPQMIGHALIKKSLTELEKLYQTTGQKEKIPEIQNDIKEINSEIESLQKSITNAFGR